VVAGAEIVLALQTIASRNVDPLDACVVSVTQFHAGTADNIIPQSAWLNGTVRTLKAGTRDMVERRIREIVAGLASAMGAEARVEYRRNYPATVNHPAQTDFAAAVARKVAGESRVDTDAVPVMGAEDFSFMLEARPGAFIFLGNGDSAKLHHPSYDFNDAALPYGMSYWVELVETALAP
jgi:amidohydrolase